MLASPVLSLQIEALFAQYERIDGKFELVAGRVVDGRGGSVRHARVIGNILFGLVDRLRRADLKPLNGQMGLLIDSATVFYPDVAVYGDRRDLDLQGDARVSRFPKWVFEVTSPSTIVADRGYKLDAYKKLDTLQAIVLVDPLDQRIELHERLAPNEWRHLILPRESGVTLRDPALELGFNEIFAGK